MTNHWRMRMKWVIRFISECHIFYSAVGSLWTSGAKHASSPGVTPVQWHAGEIKFRLPYEEHSTAIWTHHLLPFKTIDIVLYAVGPDSVFHPQLVQHGRWLDLHLRLLPELVRILPDGRSLHFGMNIRMVSAHYSNVWSLNILFHDWRRVTHSYCILLRDLTILWRID